ncbi:MAG TPA: hypothetical protein VD966_12900, partial [Pyrinomonadaceae bacterium]|nr:hypothetical protein [Pyrinomonadaceae bacterium]
MGGAAPINRATLRSGALPTLAAVGPTYGALIALVLLLIANVVFTPNFADPHNVRNILLQVSPTML